MALSEQEKTKFLLHRATEKAGYIYKMLNSKKILRNNELETMKERQKFQLRKFNDLKTNFINETEYSMMLETFNLESLEKKKEIDTCEKYSARVHAFYNFTNAILQNNKEAVELGFKKLTESVQEEILANYQSQISYIRQRKALYSRHKAYLMALKKESIDLYELKKDDLPTTIEMDNLDIKQYDLEHIIYRIEKYFSTNDPKFDKNCIVEMTLLNENIFEAVNTMYPDLESVIFEQKSNGEKSARGGY